MPLNQQNSNGKLNEKETKKKKKLSMINDEYVAKQSIAPFPNKAFVKSSKNNHNENRLTIVEKLANLESDDFKNNLQNNFLNFQSNLLKNERIDEIKNVNYGFAFSCIDPKEEKKIAGKLI